MSFMFVSFEAKLKPDSFKFKSFPNSKTKNAVDKTNNIIISL